MTTRADLDKTLNTVRALLAKAEDCAATPEEAEAYNAKAAELIARYGIDAAMLADAEPTSDLPSDKVIVLAAPYALDKRDLLVAVAHPLRCRTVSQVRYEAGLKVHKIHLFGMASDVGRVELVYTSLLVQAAYGLAAAEAPYYEDLRAYRRSWYSGFSAAVYQRLLNAERRVAMPQTDVSSGGRSVALVLADRTALVDRRVAETYPHLTTGTSRQLSGSGRHIGYQAGQRADLGGQRIGSPVRLGVGA